MLTIPAAIDIEHVKSEDSEKNIPILVDGIKIPYLLYV